MYIKYIFLFSLFIGFIFADESSSNLNVTKDIAASSDKLESSSKGDGHLPINSSPPNTSVTPSINVTSNPSITDSNTNTTDSNTNTTDSVTNITSTSTTPLPPTSPSSSVSSPSTLISTNIPTSTSQPTTPSPTSPSTTPAPVAPEFWTVTNSSNNITCIVARMNIELEIHHENKSLTLKGNPQSLRASGTCGKDLQTLEIFLPQNYSNSTASVLFNFDETEETYFISSLSISIPLDSSFTVSETKNVSLYETGKNTSYSCPSYMLNLEPGNKTTVKLSMDNIQVEAFRFTSTTIFSHAVQCPNSEVPDIVPLIVGLALAGLVIVVVIGYFIGRRRSQSRGYLSM